MTGFALFPAPYAWIIALQHPALTPAIRMLGDL